MKKWITTLALWLCWGFALGTILLLGPLRKTVDYARNNDWGDRRENLAVFFFIALLAVVSFLLARYSAKILGEPSRSGATKSALVVVPAIAALAALYILMNPALVNADSSSRTELSAQFTIGPYPDADKMKELKNEGFTALVTLLHPAVVPFEPKLLSEERELAKQRNIEVISIPMLPWVSNNQEAIDSFRDLVRTAKGKYYIHCYLGKDRVNVARRIIEQEIGAAPDMAQNFAPRSLDSVKRFERGEVYKLDNEVYLAPMPTKEEYMGYVVAAKFRQVVSLADLSDPEARAASGHEQSWLVSYGIPYKVFDISGAADGARMQGIVDSLKSLPRPVFVHSFRTDEPVAELLLKTYK